MRRCEAPCGQRHEPHRVAEERPDSSRVDPANCGGFTDHRVSFLPDRRLNIRSRSPTAVAPGDPPVFSLVSVHQHRVRGQCASRYLHRRDLDRESEHLAYDRVATDRDRTVSHRSLTDRVTHRFTDPERTPPPRRSGHARLRSPSAPAAAPVGVNQLSSRATVAPSQSVHGSAPRKQRGTRTQPLATLQRHRYQRTVLAVQLYDLAVVETATPARSAREVAPDIVSRSPSRRCRATRALRRARTGSLLQPQSYRRRRRRHGAGTPPAFGRAGSVEDQTALVLGSLGDGHRRCSAPVASRLHGQRFHVPPRDDDVTIPPRLGATARYGAAVRA